MNFKSSLFRFLALLPLILIAPIAAQADEAQLTEKWAASEGLATPECVLYNPEAEVLYVACIAGVPPREADGDGYIARLSPQGELLEEKWVTGMNGPKGMGRFEGTLYVTDNTEIVEIDIEKGEIAKRYPVEGASFLNDITVSPEGVVYASDSDTGKIHVLKDGEVSVLVEPGPFDRPNGLHHLGDGKLLVASSADGQVEVLDVESGEVELKAEGISHGDGIAPLGNGDFLVTNWEGEIFYLTADWQLTRLLDTREKMNTADIEFIQDENLLLVPTFFDNRVVAYELEVPAE
jgi:sugar lactone lactonase YvrE